jgi:hypothetical protein
MDESNNDANIPKRPEPLGCLFYFCQFIAVVIGGSIALLIAVDQTQTWPPDKWVGRLIRYGSMCLGMVAATVLWWQIWLRRP